MTPTAWAIAYATRATVFIWMLNARLVPDTSLYAHGRASWSSPLLSASGLAFGRLGVDVVSVIAAGALGYIVNRAATDRRAGLFSLALFLSPPGFFAGFPSADAAGAAGAVHAVRRRTRAGLAIAAACHLEAALVALCVLAAHRLGVRRVGAVALGAGLVAMLAQWHLQTRYLLPGAAIVAARCAL
jgi:hypothetical protein